MEAKVKEELPDKDYQGTNTEKKKSTASSKDRRTPEQEDRTSPTLAPSSPQQNGTADSVSPPLGEGSRSVPALHRLKRFLSALQQFASDVGSDTGDRVKQLIHNLVGGSMTVEEFQVSVQESTNYPLRASVPGFLRALLPHAQRDLHSRARLAKQTPLQYIRAHENLIIETSGEPGDIFASATLPSAESGLKRRTSDPFYDGTLPQTNGNPALDPMEYAPQPKRPAPSSLFVNPSPFLYPMPGAANMFDYTHAYHQGYHSQGDGGFDRRDGGITVRDVQSMNANFADGRPGLPPSAANLAPLRNDDEWKNINTMLNCILSMVEKTKRALSILQQRGVEPTENSDIKRAAGEIMASAVRQTEERVAEVRRRAEDAVNQVKRQALIDLQRAVTAAESKALELVAAERTKMERMLAERLQERRSSPPPGSRDVSPTPAANTQQNCCWNCGRKAQETCSGCNAARYCGSFCQHKDWENHHQVCSGRDQKPSSILATSPPVTQTTVAKTMARSTTPIAGSADRHPVPADRHPVPADRHPVPADRHAGPADRHAVPADRHSATGDRHPSTTESRLSLTTLNNAERMLSSNQERSITTNSTERIALATLSSGQGLIGGIGGKK